MDIILNMVRGDTMSFGVEIEGIEQDLDTAFFSCKKSLSDTAYIFQKNLENGIYKVETGVYGVRVAPEDTQNLVAGKYYVDMQISLNSDVFTILKGVLNIEEDVTREE